MTVQDFAVIVVTQIVLWSLSVMQLVPRLEAEPRSVCDKLAFLLKTQVIF